MYRYLRICLLSSKPKHTSAIRQQISSGILSSASFACLFAAWFACSLHRTHYGGFFFLLLLHHHHHHHHRRRYRFICLRSLYAYLSEIKVANEKRQQRKRYDEWRNNKSIKLISSKLDKSWIRSKWYALECQSSWGKYHSVVCFKVTFIDFSSWSSFSLCKTHRPTHRKSYVMPCYLYDTNTRIISHLPNLPKNKKQKALDFGCQELRLSLFG